MVSPGRIAELTRDAYAGDMPPRGDLASVDAVIGFSFGTYLSSDGKQVVCPGPVNEALAEMLVACEPLRSKPLALQEELALAVRAQDRSLDGRIELVPTLDPNKPGKPRSTLEVVSHVMPQLIAQRVGSVAVVAFRHHMPRAEAHVRRVGLDTAVPDVRRVGDFDPDSPWPFIRSRSEWMKRELFAIAYFAVRDGLA